MSQLLLERLAAGQPVRHADLQAWADRGLVTSTSDPRGGIVAPAKAAASQGRNAGTSGLR